MDNFDLKKFLKENKAFENLNPSVKALNENESREERADVDKYEYEKGKEDEKKKMTKEAMKKHIKDMIVAELDGAAVAAEDYDPVYEGDSEDYELEDRKIKHGVNPELDDEDYSDYFFDINTPEDELEEAKKKKDEEVEDTEDIEVTDTEDMSADEEMPTEETPTDVDGSLEDISADMKGTEGELMDHLMSAFKIAKGMNNEKLETQVGNTLKFFVSEYIGGGED